MASIAASLRAYEARAPAGTVVYKHLAALRPELARTIRHHPNTDYPSTYGRVLMQFG